MMIFTLKDFLKLLSVSLLLGVSIGTLGNAFQQVSNAGGLEGAVKSFIISHPEG